MIAIPTTLPASELVLNTVIELHLRLQLHYYGFQITLVQS